MSHKPFLVFVFYVIRAQGFQRIWYDLQRMWYEVLGSYLREHSRAPFSRNAGAVHYPKVVSAAKGDRSHTIAGVSLRAQNAESLYALREIAYNITIHPLARSAGEGAGGERALLGASPVQ
jgi:hypothetical protein